MSIIFGVLIDHDKAVSNYIEYINEKLQSNNLIKNPFNDSMVKEVDITVNNKIKTLAIFNFKIIYPNIPIFFIIPLVVIYYFWGFTLWLIIPALFLSLSLLWTKYFYYIIFKLGLKKNAGKFKTKLLTSKYTLELLLNNGEK